MQIGRFDCALWTTTVLRRVIALVDAAIDTHEYGKSEKAASKAHHERGVDQASERLLCLRSMYAANLRKRI